MPLYIQRPHTPTAYVRMPLYAYVRMPLYIQRPHTPTAYVRIPLYAYVRIPLYAYVRMPLYIQRPHTPTDRCPRCAFALRPESSHLLLDSLTEP